VGFSDFDVRNILAINALWMIPSPQSWSSVPKWAASGWQVGGIFMYGRWPAVYSAYPEADPLGLKARAPSLLLFPERGGRMPSRERRLQIDSQWPRVISMRAVSRFRQLTFLRTHTLPRLLGNFRARNTVIGPDLKDLDFSLFKNNPVHRISETFNVQFRWEIFNIANHAKLQSATTWEPSNFLGDRGRECQRRAFEATSTTSRQDAVRPKIHLVSDFCVQSERFI